MKLLADSISNDFSGMENLPIVSSSQLKHDYYQINNGGISFITGVISDSKGVKDRIMFNKLFRSQYSIICGENVSVSEIKKKSLPSIQKLHIIVSFFTQPQIKNLNTDDLFEVCKTNFADYCININQSLILQFNGTYLKLTIEKIFESPSKKVDYGLITAKTLILYEKDGNPLGKEVVLIGEKIIFENSLLESSFDFSAMGIGGLDTQVAELFRRVFSSRLAPQALMQQMGVKHVKGCLLHGPPGTGKTLIARKIAQMLKAKPAKIVNGPEILDKYVGESERKLRELFKEPEDDYQKYGNKSMLHVIIFDELDAICRQRGESRGSQAADNVVNQLLTKIDGLSEINNLLIIGMTNRPDLIDEALLRPGRLEVQLEISLPDMAGRVQILNIHTSSLRNNQKLGKDVEIEELALQTQNFTGAEIEGLVRAAVSNSYNEYIKAGEKVEVSLDISKALVSSKHFQAALQHDIIPAFGAAHESLKAAYSNGIIMWGPSVRKNIKEGNLLINKAKNANRLRLTSVLVEGSPKYGTTAFGANLALQSKFDFIKMISAQNMVGRHESVKSSFITRTFKDAYKCENSCIFIDDFERLIEYVDVGPMFTNSILQTLITHLKTQPPKNHKLLVIVSSCRSDLINSFGIRDLFSSTLELDPINEPEELMYCLEEMSSTLHKVVKEKIDPLSFPAFCIGIKALVEVIEICENLNEEDRAQAFVNYISSFSLTNRLNQLV